MGKRFDIIISATDKTTEAVKRVNERLAKIKEPFQKVGASFKALGEELGVKNIGTRLKKVGVAARDTAGKIGAIVAPLAAISSVTSVAGMAALAAHWAKLGQHVTYTAQAVGISTSQLQKMQQLGALSGVGADAMASSLETLGDTMEDARWGRNTGAMMMFNRLGIGLRRTAKGSWDVIGQMKAVAKAMNAPQLKNNPWAQKVIAQQFGLTAILPFLRQGEEGIARYEAMQQRLGYTMDAGKADRFAESLAGLKVAGEGLKNTIADSVMPVMRPFIEELAQWIADNRELISQKVAEWAQKVGDWIKTIDWHQVGEDVTDLVKGIGKFIDALGGIKGTVIAVGIAMNAGLIASVVNLTAAIGVPMLKGIGALIVKLGLWKVAATEAAEATEAAAAAGEAGALAKGGAGPISRMGGLGWLLAPRPEDTRDIMEQDPWLKQTNDLSWIDRWKVALGMKSVGGEKPIMGPSPAIPASAATGPAAGGPLPLGLRQNNPGNLRQWGSNPRANGFAVFATPDEGVQAMAHQLQLYGSRGNDTLAGIVNTYAPAADRNNTGAYLAALTQRTGFSPTQHLNLNDPTTVAALTGGIIQHEQGRNPYSAEMINANVRAGLGVAPAGVPAGPSLTATTAMQHETTILVNIPNAPAGTTVTAISPTDHVTVKPTIGFPAVGAMAS